MYHLSRNECIHVSGGEAFSFEHLSTPQQIGKIVGCVSGVLIATPFWFGVPLFSQNREMSYSLGMAALGITYFGCDVGEKIGTFFAGANIDKEHRI